MSATGATNDIMLQEHRLATAVTWRNADENISGRDPGYELFCQIMHERREIAKRYFIADHGSKDREILLELFNEYNDRIKQVLGL